MDALKHPVSFQRVKGAAPEKLAAHNSNWAKLMEEHWEAGGRGAGRGPKTRRINHPHIRTPATCRRLLHHCCQHFPRLAFIGCREGARERQVAHAGEARESGSAYNRRRAATRNRCAPESGGTRRKEQSVIFPNRRNACASGSNINRLRSNRSNIMPCASLLLRSSRPGWPDGGGGQNVRALGAGRAR
jgi:hypothetical protein